MKKNNTIPADAAELRRRAEELLKEKKRGSRGAGEEVQRSAEGTQRLVQELQIHQVELEMQNEELRRAQGELEAARARYFDLFDLAPIGYFTVSEAGLMLEVNLTAANMLGVARGALVKQPLTRFILPEDRDIYYRHRKLLFETGAPQVCEMRMVKKDAAPFWAQMEARLAQNAEGAPVCRAVVSDITVRNRVEAELQQVRDELEHRVTERTEALRRANEELRTDIISRKRAEEALRVSEENFRRSMDESPLGIGIVSEEGEIVYANRVILDFFGYESIKELREKPLTKHYTESSYDEFLDRKEKRHLHADNSSDYEIDIVRKDGEVRHIQVWRKRVIWNGKEHYQVIYRDITDHKQAEEMLHRAEENYRRSLEDSPLGVRIATIEGATIYANRAILNIYGYDSVEELKTTPIENRYTPQSYAEFKIRMEKRKGDDGPSEYEINIVRENGEIRHLQVLCKDVLWDGERQFQVIYQDITERKRAEKEVVETIQQLQETRDMLIQFEKHAAVGRLAAGVAHEILNPASIISSRLQFLEEENLSAPARENVRISREQLQRIVKISHDLLQSSAKTPRVLVGGDLRRVIEVGLQMTERRRKEDHVQVEYDPPSEVIPVKMERDRLVKVIVNLILNACDAMTDKQVKQLIIAVYRPEVSSMRPSVRLIVTDNGHGILTGELDKIFEPFFTRKDPGKSTGLGLSVSKGIIQEHGGTIHVENNDMGGASFIVELPLDHP